MSFRAAGTILTVRRRRTLACAIAVLVGTVGAATWSALPASAITPGFCPTCQEGAERSARESVEIQEHKEAAEREARERAAREAHEREVREAHEREVREAHEREAREQREQVEREAGASSRSARCVVPRLKGDSLSAARKALLRAHCALGKVTKPAARGGRLVVTTQSPHAGRKLASNTAVGVKLGPASQPSKRR
jgi:hypothetical protein